MNKKLISLAVAAAMTAPAAALADATLYGKLHVSLDYADVKNVVAPTYAFTTAGGGRIAINNAGNQQWISRGPVVFSPANYGGRLYLPAGTGTGVAGVPPILINAVPVQGVAPAGYFPYPVNASVRGNAVIPFVAAIGNTYRVRNGAPTYARVINGEDFKGWGMSSNGFIPGAPRSSRIGVKGSEDLGGGLKAVYQVEFGINLNDTNNNVINNADAITMRNSFVGLAGNFGTVLFGRHDTPLKISTGKLDLFADTMMDYNGTVGFRDLRADNVVAYISPSWSGFQFAGAIVPAGGATGGAGTNLYADSIGEAWSVAGIYKNGPFYASLAYENLGEELLQSTATNRLGSICPNRIRLNAPGPNDPFFASCSSARDDATAWRIGLGLLDWNGFSLTGIYESRDHEPGSGAYIAYVDPRNVANSYRLYAAPEEAELWQIQAAYSFGNNTIKAMYGQADYDGSNLMGANYIRASGGAVWAAQQNSVVDYDIETWGIGFDHNFSKRTRLYALYTDVTSSRSEFATGSGEEWSGFSLGMIHNF